MDKTSVEAIRSEVKLADYFEKVYFSCELKHGKLDKEIILKIAKEFNTKPEEMLFIDDFEGNVDAAANFRMQTVLFVGFADLKQKMAALLKNRVT